MNAKCLHLVRGLLTDTNSLRVPINNPLSFLTNGLRVPITNPLSFQQNTPSEAARRGPARRGPERVPACYPPRKEFFIGSVHNIQSVRVAESQKSTNKQIRPYITYISLSLIHSVESVFSHIANSRDKKILIANRRDTKILLLVLYPLSRKKHFLIEAGREEKDFSCC